jgi:hypothetical protein
MTARKAHRPAFECGHDWQPLERWSGRYRCRDCRTIAYRKLVIGRAKRGRPEEIIPYKCKCGNLATYRSHELGRNFCFDCLKKRKVPLP